MPKAMPARDLAADAAMPIMPSLAAEFVPRMICGPICPRPWSMAWGIFRASESMRKGMFAVEMVLPPGVHDTMPRSWRSTLTLSTPTPARR